MTFYKNLQPKWYYVMVVVSVVIAIAAIWWATAARAQDPVDPGYGMEQCSAETIGATYIVNDPGGPGPAMASTFAFPFMLVMAPFALTIENRNTGIQGGRFWCHLAVIGKASTFGDARARPRQTRNYNQ